MSISPARSRRGESEQPRAGREGAGPAPRLYQRAFDILAAQIEDGVLAPGARLIETAVADQFGISRAPARRALAELERSGLLVKTTGRGYAVRAPAKGAGSSGVATPREDIRLTSRSSWERIYAEVEDEIIGRISFASWRVNEAELARCYHVSRTVARDVVGRLQQRGVIRKDERSRWYAPALTPEHVGELYELRSILEPVALTKAAPSLPRDFLLDMRKHLEEAIAHADAIEGPTLDRLEEEMHVALLQYCGNRTLMQAITLPQSLLIAHRFLYRWTPRLFNTEPFLPEHLEVLRHLESGDVDKAASALEHHLKVSAGRALARVDVIRREFQAESLPYLERLQEK
ncbi:GntR family transcriptional regulator [Chelativorans salis]|uniref:GntR family transcriptional regulator n=1 Tax=Chelativorans salis TaxID=2978478 RepID=A0ABT2LLB1_9HYPH|nr:GntR family transcriptional regulator [Chelativorans sp. EGI FJ00035]MCT7374178.1 GntR family transcriptional regulator [Chelativorans sp. EGI FJ00035]